MNKEVAVYVDCATICLDCATEEERDRAEEDQSIHDYWITNDECFGHFTLWCDRCGKQLGNREEYEKEKVSSRIAVTVHGSWGDRDSKYGSYGLVVCLDCLTPQEKEKPEQQEDRNYLTKEDIEQRVWYMPTKEGKKQVGSCGRCGKLFIQGKNRNFSLGFSGTAFSDTGGGTY